MTSPKISIIIPTLNRHKLLCQALASIQSQTFEAWEALTVDDGSDAITVETIQSFCRKDPRIRYIKRYGENLGAPTCRNQGIEVAQGKYIIFLDSDDCLKSTALATRFQFMESRPQLDFAVFPCLLFKEEPGDMNILWNISTQEEDIDRFLAQDIPWQTTSPIWRKESLIKLGQWNEALPSWQDWEFHLRALIRNFSYTKFNEPDCYWRVPDASNHSNSIGKKSISNTHLVSHRRLFIDIYLDLVTHEKLTDKRRDLVSGLCIWLLDKLLFQNEILEAESTWNLYLEKAMIDETTYYQGSFYIDLIKHSQCNSFLRRATRRSLLVASKFILPYEKRPYKQKLLRKVKVSA